MFGHAGAFTVALLYSLLSTSAVAGKKTAAPHPATTFAECQSKTADPLQGCPKGTIYVSAKDSGAAFTSIQAAILSLPDDATAHHILIGAGIYNEQLNVTRAGPLYLLGQSDLPSQGKTYAGDVTYTSDPQNDVQVHYNSANVGGTLLPDNAFTSVLTVGPTLEATLTGSGPTGYPVPENTPFGNTDFRAYNIDFRNEYAQSGIGPSLAIGISRANAGFYGCGFYSWQDSIYVGKLGNTYFYDTVVAGQTDFLYGFGTLYITHSTLSLRHCGGGVTAWKGANTTFTNKYGVYIDASQLLANNETTIPAIKGKCALGRPWNDAHRSIFMDSYFDGSILPAGYIIWSTSTPRVDEYTFMATYKNTGPGSNPEAQAASNVTKVLTDASVAPYRWPKDVFLSADGTPGNDQWIDGVAKVPLKKKKALKKKW